MPARFVPIDRNTPLLLPPSIQDWLPEDHPARLIVDLVESLELSSASINHKGTGSAQYPPSMMLSLLLYSYSGGVFSSREIERGTYDDVALRYICAETHPDHDTICSFRRGNKELIRSAFSQSLRIAAQVGLIRVGNINIAFDGSKIPANASRHQSKTLAEIEAEIQQLDHQTEQLGQTVIDLLEEAEVSDQREEKAHVPIPAELITSEMRVEKLREAKKLIQKKERRRARLAIACETRAEQKKKQSERREKQREEIRESEIGRAPKSLDSEVRAEDRINLSDPESTRLRGDCRAIEGYNAQGSVDTDGSGLIVGCHVCTDGNDRQQLEANVAEVEANLGVGSIATAVADKGYDNVYQIHKIETRGGPMMICDQQGDPEKAKNLKGRDKRTNELRCEHKRRRKKPENEAKLKRRRETIEPTFGIIKEQMNYRRFRLRGEAGADLEWRLIAFGFNLRKLSREENWKKEMRKRRIY